MVRNSYLSTALVLAAIGTPTSVLAASSSACSTSSDADYTYQITPLVDFTFYWKWVTKLAIILNDWVMFLLWARPKMHDNMGNTRHISALLLALIHWNLVQMTGSTFKLTVLLMKSVSWSFQVRAPTSITHFAAASCLDCLFICSCTTAAAAATGWKDPPPSRGKSPTPVAKLGCLWGPQTRMGTWLAEKSCWAFLMLAR